MENEYLIPANTKKSLLWLGFFTPIDAVIFGIGIIVSFALVLMVPNLTIGLIVLLLTPALISTFLVMPVPNYHNILQLLTNIYKFYFGRRKYYWRGWCIREER